MSQAFGASNEKGSGNVRASVIPWERDSDYSLNLNVDHNTSAEILLRWLTIPKNFDMYRGENRPDVPKKTKAAVLKQIVEFFNDNGISYRKPKNIRSRIDRMVNSYREAVDWKTSYENGTLEPSFYENLARKSEDQKQYEIKSQILKICKEYDRIHPFLKDATWPAPVPPTSKGKSIAKEEEEDTDSESESISSQDMAVHTDKVHLVEMDTLEQPSTSSPVTPKKRDFAAVDTLMRNQQTPKRARPADDVWKKDNELQQMTLMIAESDTKRAELEIKQAKASLERESMHIDIMIKKNKAALESLKFMYEEGLLTKEEYKEKCTKIISLYHETEI